MGFAKEKKSELKSFVSKCKRVWIVLKKPSKNEYQTVAKISALGILAVGAVGFLVAMLMKLFT